MTSWSHGYVSDIEYLPGFYVDQTPGHLQLSCLIKGYEPPLTNEVFTYCELGCGQGTTASIIAAANPQAHVTAIDFNPAHIARAKRIADQSGLNNIEFLELSFDELIDKQSLRDFDIVSLHGVWSWISQNDRDAIVKFLDKGVKAGGLVSLSYNAMPGWTSILPFQRMLLEYSRLTIDRSDKRVIGGLDFIDKLQKLGCLTVGDEKFFGRFRSNNKTRSEQDHAVYLAHEYLNENWQPLYHADTVKMLAAAKLNFVASATILDNFSDLQLTPEQMAVTNSLPQGVMRETIKDYFVNRPFRRDIFIRGAQVISDARRDELLGKIGLASLVEASAAKYTISTPAGEATLPQSQYEPIFNLLAQKPRTLREIHENLTSTQQEKIPALAEIAGILVGTSQALPLPWGIHENKNYTTTLFNQNATKPALNRESSFVALASPLASSGLNLNAIESVVYHFAAKNYANSEILTESLNFLTQGSNPIMIDGKLVNEPDEIIASLKEGVLWAIENRIPLWKTLLMLD